MARSRSRSKSRSSGRGRSKARSKSGCKVGERREIKGKTYVLTSYKKGDGYAKRWVPVKMAAKKYRSRSCSKGRCKKVVECTQKKAKGRIQRKKSRSRSRSKSKKASRSRSRSKSKKASRSRSRSKGRKSVSVKPKATSLKVGTVRTIGGKKMKVVSYKKGSGYSKRWAAVKRGGSKSRSRSRSKGRKASKSRSRSRSKKGRKSRSRSRSKKGRSRSRSKSSYKGRKTGVSRRIAFNNPGTKTAGGLDKSKLKMNKRGRIVSKKRSEAAKRNWNKMVKDPDNPGKKIKRSTLMKRYQY